MALLLQAQQLVQRAGAACPQRSPVEPGFPLDPLGPFREASSNWLSLRGFRQHWLSQSIKMCPHRAPLPCATAHCSYGLPLAGSCCTPPSLPATPPPLLTHHGPCRVLQSRHEQADHGDHRREGFEHLCDSRQGAYGRGLLLAVKDTRLLVAERQACASCDSLTAPLLPHTRARRPR